HRAGQQVALEAHRGRGVRGHAPQRPGGDRVLPHPGGPRGRAGGADRDLSARRASAAAHHRFGEAGITRLRWRDEIETWVMRPQSNMIALLAPIEPVTRNPNTIVPP